MGGFLLVSIGLLISLSDKTEIHDRNITSNSILFASIILICAASLTKQAAIIWSILFFPLLGINIIKNNSNLKNYTYLALIPPILAPILWFILGGNGFQRNSGVIERSFGDRTYLEQLFFGFNEVFINHLPILFFIILVFFILFTKANIQKIILASGIICSTLLIILFGAYETSRMYLHVLLIGWLVIFAYGNNFFDNKISQRISLIGSNKITYLLIGSLFVYWSFNSFNGRMNGISYVENILDGREVQINWVIGKSGAEEYRKIANSNMGLWARDNHIWGIYYGMENFYRGELSNPDSVYVLNKIIDNKIGWIYSNEVYMKKLIEFCKPSFLKLNTSKNLYNQTLYKISINEIKSCLKKN